MDLRLCLTITAYALLLSTVASKYAKIRNSKTKDRRVNPALCNPDKIPYGCMAVPRDCDIMDLQTFRQNVSGSFLPLFWRIDAAGFLREELLVLRVSELAVQVVGNAVRFGFKGRADNTSGAACQVVRATTDIPDGTVVNSKLAIFDVELVVGPPIGTSVWRFHFTSDQPEDYILAMNCANRDNIINGVCYDRWVIDIFLRKGKFDRPPMHKIVRELWKKFRLKFDDHRNTFVRIGYECPDEVL